jgi:hypothetical protein
MQSRPTIGAHMTKERRDDVLERLARRRPEDHHHDLDGHQHDEEPPLDAYTEPHEDVTAGAYLQPATPARRTSYTAAELMAITFPEPRWAVPGVIPEGLTVLAGAPKVGKSWFAANGALAVAQGGRAFGRVAVEQGAALYMALEDPPRRLQQRLSMMLAGSPAPAELTLATECDPFPAGIDRIDRWLRTAPNPRLVIVDVWAKVRPALQDKGSQYLADYAAASPLKTLADEHGVAIVLLHHTRKMGAEDFLDTVSGTNGITGAADTIMVLKRARNAADAILSITGRDVSEAEHALTFDATLGTWSMLAGPASDYAMASTRRAIVAAVRDAEGIGPKAIAEATGIEYATVKQTVRRMVDDDQLDTDGEGRYFPPVSLSLLSPESPSDPLDPGDSDSGDRGDTPTGGSGR